MVDFVKFCDEINNELYNKINHLVESYYDVHEDLFFVKIFNVELSDFDEISARISKFSLNNREKYGTYCIPMLYTKSQTLKYYPKFAAIDEGVYCSIVDNTWSLKTKGIHLHVLGEDEENDYAAAA